MTLDTHAFILDPVDPEPLYEVVDALLRRVRPGEARWYEPVREIDVATRRRVVRNPPGVGLPGWLWITHATDGPIVPDEGDCIPGVPYCVDVSIDTSYGYRGPNGADCDDIHAWLLVEIDDYLAGLRLPPRWVWEHEYSGEIRQPPSVDREAFARFGDPERGRLG